MSVDTQVEMLSKWLEIQFQREKSKLKRKFETHQLMNDINTAIEEELTEEVSAAREKI